MFNKLNEFFTIESQEYKKYNKERMKQNTRIEEFRSEIM